MKVIKSVQNLISEVVNAKREALLTTCGLDMKPHTCWMGTVVMQEQEVIYTMTSPESRKVQNIADNPNVEWLFTGEGSHQIAYVRGRTSIIHDPAEVKKVWSTFPDVGRAFFLQYQDELGMQFVILKTEISEVEFAEPRNNMYERQQL